LYGEAQLRLHMTSVFTLEGLAGYEQNSFGGTTVNVFPVQASLLIYLLPGRRISPYLLGGGGWYYTQVQGQSGAQNRFGPHAGAGLQIFLDHCWSIDGSWRYIWNENIHSQDAAHPLGQNFTAGGFMLTAAINYHF
jgi:opacity protein-like surface antigen